MSQTSVADTLREYLSLLELLDDEGELKSDNELPEYDHLKDVKENIKTWFDTLIKKFRFEKRIN